MSDDRLMTRSKLKKPGKVAKGGANSHKEEGVNEVILCAWMIDSGSRQSPTGSRVCIDRMLHRCTRPCRPAGWRCGMSKKPGKGFARCRMQSAKGIIKSWEHLFCSSW